MAQGESSEIFVGHDRESFNYFLERSDSEERQFQFFTDVLPAEFKRLGEGKTTIDVLGVGSGGGPNDAHILSILQSTLPNVSISVDVVEPSPELTNNFRERRSKHEHLRNIPFTWYTMTAEDYERTVKAKGDVKKYDFIHMVQMLYYVEDYAHTMEFYRSLLKENGTLMIIQCKVGSGWDLLWKAYGSVLRRTMISHITAGDVASQLTRMGLKHQENLIPSSADITDCFREGDRIAELLLDFLTDQINFNRCFSPELRAEILQHLRNKCSTEKDGRVLYNSDSTAIVVRT